MEDYPSIKPRFEITEEYGDQPFVKKETEEITPLVETMDSFRLLDLPPSLHPAPAPAPASDTPDAPADASLALTSTAPAGTGTIENSTTNTSTANTQKIPWEWVIAALIIFLILRS